MYKSTSILIAILAFFSTIAICDSTKTIQAQQTQEEISSDADISSILKSESGADQAYIWYLFHCGYAVKTKTKLLIFDYVRRHWVRQDEPEHRSLSNGWINPEEIKNLDVYVFVSHSHKDHYDSTILGWQDTLNNITYFFGWDEAEGSKYHNMVGPREIFKECKIEVYTINSNQNKIPEVAYLVKTDDLFIYHGGDYNGDIESDFAFLATFVDKLDFMMANDGCVGQITEPIRLFKPDLIFPGHFGGEEHKRRTLVDCLPEYNFGCEVKSPLKRGHMFSYNRGDYD
ncbi:MAG: hypothetical protein V3V99_07955 [candidate division Zixibacteria bacterium]